MGKDECQLPDQRRGTQGHVPARLARLQEQRPGGRIVLEIDHENPRRRDTRRQPLDQMGKQAGQIEQPGQLVARHACRISELDKQDGQVQLGQRFLLHRCGGALQPFPCLGEPVGLMQVTPESARQRLVHRGAELGDPAQHPHQFARDIERRSGTEVTRRTHS